MFTELLGRSCFSFLRGASQPEEMVDRASELDLDAIALCDRDGLYGSARAFTRSKETGQRVVVGAELTLAHPGESVSRDRAWKASSSKKKSEPERPVLCLLAEDHAGYTNLCKLLTLSHGGLPKGECLLELDFLAAHSRGLVAVIPVDVLASHRKEEGAGSLGRSEVREVLARVRDVFGDRAFIGVSRHRDGYDGARNAVAMHHWRRFGLDIVASARPLFHHRSRKPLADVVHCIREGTTLDRAGTALAGNAEAYLRSEKQMREIFAEHPRWVDRAGEVGERLRFDLGELEYQFPCELEAGQTADGTLRKLTEQGLRRRYPEGASESVRRQVEKELTLIAKLGVAPYFLSTHEIVEIAREKRILCQGRGSAANSAVCYALGITAVDPARSNLLFERFMSAERSEPPDIDIDFEHERREEVIQEIYARYGRDRAAMVSEIISYRGKSALRETGKTFGLSLEQIDRLSGSITHWDSAEVSDKRLKDYGFDIEDARLRQTVMLARALEGFPRHLSIHVGGFVLSAAPLNEVAPVEPARREDRTVIPWDKDDLEVLGFFKVDVLGLGMLTAIRKSLELVHECGGLQNKPTESVKSAGTSEPFDPLDVITRVPAEESAVYEMISRADTIGVFQIESRAQMSMLPRLRPARFYDLVIEVAIVRPGPIQGGMVHPFLRRRNGEEHITSPHPDLWPILERTLGVPLFQEQVMQISIVGAGYSGGQADQLRRDMAAWKKNGRLMRHRDRLLDGFANKGISRKFGEALFEQIKGFGDYGFPESHAASFALLVYSSSWLKAHYPAHFTCALINSQPMGFYSVSTLLRDAQKHGVEVRDVSIVHSFWDCTLEKTSSRGIDSRLPGAQRAIRLGLRLVKGLGEAPAREIERARAESSFSGLEDLIRRAHLHKDQVEALAEAGALEELVPGRRHALWKARAPRVGGLFERLDVREPTIKLPALRKSEQLLLDYGRKGLSVDDHPMCHLRGKMKQMGVVTAEELQSVEQGKPVKMAGMVLSRQQPGTASGVVFITLEDETGFANLILYRRIFEEFRLTARHSTLMMASGTVERQVTVPKTDLGFQFGAKDAVAIVHLLVKKLDRLDVPGRDVTSTSRDFH